MLRVQRIKVDDIYVPAARRKTLHPETVRQLAEDILENGMKMPIQVRHDGKRHVLIEGLHRLEAAKWLGETTIDAYFVHARRR
ncbi:MULTISPECIES: ParB N-terminal domain-containing protein [unclassified Mesorhizobium]|uniref:ParB N-terminal domain-containing protein n=1 Tax=unclassified Mesorhizobium TaxID=325217 RepID=UPI000BAFE214|nr:MULTISPECIES: ParB N-terminal domain-containing protein [unclassified Mesorhizobium]TGT53374.1 chromosome partitioning protein ParB [Mesorhizobium sp. M00.F.Ca.ET.170.01.1.1]AZO12735.1 chromosome partitioning protein ParB [Mesorhizobium sp. M3A.F.Ca.ET.080.04.2.1]PBB87135.1 chromosome partitioning protein ParB [Mesorhizobium sp. WSM3876]RWB71292.1 MAG: chromosome partitioning protein ParB [Mesorhizobium sp.]RWB91242.1 MAG: chromosome partitioning protein ParB [Mesorhizobium sp.]